MKKLALMMFLICGVSFADNTYTTNAGIPKPADSDTGWGETIRDAFDIIDSSFATLSGTQTFTGSPTISSATVATLRSDRILIATPTYTNSSDELVVNGETRASGTSYFCDANFQNCSSFSSTNITFSGTPSTLITHDSLPFIRAPEASSVCIGKNSCSGITSGTSNTVLGYGSMQGTTTGSQNTAVGASALGTLSTGTFNTAIGDGSLSANTGGQANVAIGSSALGSVKAQRNVAVGYNSLSTNVNGQGNTSVGFVSGNLEGGDFNTYIGYNAGPASTLSLTNATAIGANAIPSGSNTIALGSTSTVTSTEFTPVSKTLAQLQAYTPLRLGQLFYCSDCVYMPVCYSTGTATAFAVASSSRTRCQ